MDWNLHSVSCWAESFLLFSSNSNHSCVCVWGHSHVCQKLADYCWNALRLEVCLVSISLKRFSRCEHRAYSRVVSVYIRAVYVPLDFVSLPGENRGDCLGDFLWVRLKFMPCLVLLCPLLRVPHLGCASKQYWPAKGHPPLTTIQWIAVKKGE